ncbi:sigma 54-interacting transcriptional regulator [Pyxidicoccus sp. MSG2]|uniref:sigma 54-interacting transcriptional regulator n=1 Tax=Pyxidicoccus sp. MSG2 TaxID=2996790 RepID=UPI002271D474|nr:sigma 54-interacting transcriptional regulator [Pyxidicoccus sp. MSG2]MCY1021434.1 sigma 54-interacting transcriptional regulator [Pyxidicoccus sp. MSG2]
MASSDSIETQDARSRAAPDEHGSLLVLEGDSSEFRLLPRSGTLLIGRSSSADIRVEDLSVSREHARITVKEGETWIADLDSHNGIQVNGRSVRGPQLLQSGAVVALGNVILVFPYRKEEQHARPALDAAALRVRLAEELDRVRSYERTVSVCALELGVSSVPPAELVRAASDALRPMDLVAQVGTSLMVVLPELEGEEAEEVARGLLEVLSPRVSQVRAGLVTAPQDGLNPEALLAAAQAAALKAQPGHLCVSGPGLHWLRLGTHSVLVADSVMVELFNQLRRLAASHINILIHGETGAGKENAAWAVHHWSPRAGGPFVVRNCATLSRELAESELFGHERGAFTGADRAREGVFEQASGGTLFLDEVAELSLEIQAKLLRALEQQRITRLGGSREREVDVRVVAATHRVLTEEVQAGRFRQDLYYRLSAARVMLPPLRDRPRELPLLANAFLAQACQRAGRPPPHLSAAAMGALGAFGWPGNVRELKNAMENVAATCPGPIVEPSHLPEPLYRAPAASPAPEPPQPRQDAAADTPPGPPRRTFRPLAEEVHELERQRILEALETTGGVQTRAAQLIGMPLRTFAFKLKRYRISSRGGGTAP